MKELLILMNCHGDYIRRILINSNNAILNDYNINYISYVPLLKTNSFNDDQLNMIKNADLLIIQYILNDRGMLKHEYIINIIKPTAKYFLIPHYTFGAYFYDQNIFGNSITNTVILECSNNNTTQFNFARLNTILKSDIMDVDIVGCQTKLKNSFAHINELDKRSSVKMYDFVLINYKKIKLFENHAHPRGLFFVEMCNQLLTKLNYDKINSDFYDNFTMHGNQISLIYDQTKEILELEFDNQIISGENGFGLDSFEVSLSMEEYFKIILHKNFDIKLPINPNHKKAIETIGSVNFLEHVFGNTLKKYLDIIKSHSQFDQIGHTDLDKFRRTPSL